jgi:hypothetical protein
MRKTATALLILLMLLFGCTAATGGDIEFSTLARGDNAPGITGRLNEAITDPISFESFWTDIYQGIDPIPDIPKVDFTKDMVIAVSPGMMLTGGYDAEIVKVENKENGLNVTVLLTRPSGTVTEALTQPHHIIKLKRENLPVVYKWVER